MITRLLRRISGQFDPVSEEEALLALYRRRVEIALSEQRFDAALVFLDRMLEVRPREISLRLERALLLESAGQAARALDAYLRLLPRAQQVAPEAALAIRAGIDRLTGGAGQKTNGSEDGTSETDSTAAASAPPIQSPVSETRPGESQNGFPAGITASEEIEVRTAEVAGCDDGGSAIFSPERLTA